MKSVSRASKQPPAVAEECPVAGAASAFRGKIGNDDDVEFEAFRLMHRQNTHYIVFLRNDLRFRFTHRPVVGPVAKVADDVVESGCTLVCELARDFDQFSDIGYTLGTILLRQHNDVEVGLADNILKNLSGSCRVAASDPMAEDGVEKRNPHFRRRERREFIEGDTK